MKYIRYSMIVFASLMMLSFAPVKQQRKITLPLSNHVGHIQWVKVTNYSAIKDRRGSFVKGGIIPDVETFTYDEYGDEIEDDMFDTTGAPPRKCTHLYYPNGDVKEVIKDSDINVQIGLMPDHHAGYRGPSGAKFKRVMTKFDFKYINSYDAEGKLISTTGDYRLTYASTSGKFFYDSAGNLLREFLFSFDTIHPTTVFFFWYDKTGQVTQEIMARRTSQPGYMLDLQPQTKTEYVRNEKGMITYRANSLFQVGLMEDETIKYDDSGDTLETEITDYGCTPTKGRFVNRSEVKRFIKKGTNLQECVYDVNGQLIDSTITHIDSKNHSSDMQQFHITYMNNTPAKMVIIHRIVKDSHLNVIEEDSYGNDCKVSTKNTWQYKYDNVGNWVEQISMTDDKPWQITEREIHYF